MTEQIPAERIAMSWTERQRCRFEPYQDGEGRPSHLYVELPDWRSSLLAKRQIDRLFFGLRQGVTWDEASALVEELNTKLVTFCVKHSADADES